MNEKETMLIAKQVQLQAKYDALKKSHDKLVSALRDILHQQKGLMADICEIYAKPVKSYIEKVAEQALDEAEKL